MIIPLPEAESLRTTGGVRDVRVDDSMFGAGVARGIADVGGAFGKGMELIARAGERRKAAGERQDHEAADEAYTKFMGDMDAAFSGRLDPESGELTPGLKERTLSEAKGVAKAYAKIEQEWLDNPDGAFKSLSVEQQKVFRRKAARLSARNQHQAAGYEFGELQKQRKVNREVSAGVTAQAAANAYGTDVFAEAAADAAEAAADAAVGDSARWDPAGGERVYKNSEAREAWTLAREQAAEKLNIGQRKFFLDKARESDVGDMAAIEGFIALATADLEELSPAAQTVVRNAVKDLGASVERQRSARLSDARQAEAEASRAEQGRLDKLRQEQLSNGFQDMESYARELSESPESAYASQKIVELNAFKEARERTAAQGECERLDKLRQAQLLDDFAGEKEYVRELMQSPESAYANQLIAEVKAKQDLRKREAAGEMTDAARAERVRLDDLRRAQLIDGFVETQDYMKELSGSAESAYANQFIAEVKAVESDRARGIYKQQQELLTEQHKKDQDYIMSEFTVGAYTDPSSGGVVMMDPQQTIDSAVYAFTSGAITETQMNRAIKGAEAMKDQRLAQFKQIALNKFVPEKVLAFDLDAQGRFVISEDLNKKGRRVYKPGDKSGIKREWTKEGRWGRDKHKEHVLLGEVAGALNLVALRMQVDPGMTPESAADLFGKLTSGAMAEYAKKSFDEMLSEEATMYQKMKAQGLRDKMKNIKTIREKRQ